jgi:hypothetical protein
VGAFLGCDNSETFQPSYPESLTLSDSHLGAYSSKRAEDEREIPGTQFRTDSKWTFAKSGSGYTLNRILDTMIARGYHKNSMPNELERKANLTLEFDAELNLKTIHGYDTLHAVLKKIPQQKEEWRQQLLAMSDTAQLKKSQRDLWRLFTLFPKNQPMTPGQWLDPAALNQKLETFKVDTILFKGRNPRIHKVCLDAIVQYQKSDSSILLREQFLNSSGANRKLRNSVPGIAEIKGTFVISVDKKTGLPCYWSQTEMGEMKLHDKVSQQDQIIHLIRFEEDVVQY